MMLRRRGSAVFYREVKIAAEASRPAFSAERKERLKQRIMLSLGDQAQAQSPARSRVAYQWVRVPAGVGVAATILAAASPLVARLMQDDVSSVGVLANSSGETSSVEEGRLLVAGEALSLLLRDGAGRVDMDPRSAVRVRYAARVPSIEIARGRMTVASGASEITVRGTDWHSAVAGYSIVEFEQGDGVARLSVIEGHVSLRVGSATCEAGPGEAIFIGPGPVCAVVPAATPPGVVGGSEAEKAPASPPPASAIESKPESPPPARSSDSASAPASTGSGSSPTGSPSESDPAHVPPAPHRSMLAPGNPQPV